ncbi:hypothetical protein [Rubellicoccus peritrichatus]|uniref:Uncharacterized protein n=1 Tax=Rubellicoccus peritrichatus TaxID=3080537 RepID=A0AAQ3LCB2_9BACT|nr:hypothetical protein [Puniceicoccus sp. CR14]WOO43176.1 hypothetical protein RZN69_08725 [Puniceicoccus sp. CR14]
MKTILTIVYLLCCATAIGAIPSTLPYQGRISNNGSLPTGSHHFKFAIVDHATTPTVSYWSNDLTSTTGSEPSTSHVIAITNGLFNVTLGEGGASNAAIPSTVWSNDNLILQVWYSETGAPGTFSSIDSVPILPVAHAHRATVADSLATGVSVNDADSDPTNELQTLSVNGGALSIDGGVTNVDLSNAVNTILDGSSGLGVGLSGNTPDAALHINSNTGYDGTLQGLSNRAEILDGSFATAPLGATRIIEVSGGYAYFGTTIGLIIFDVSDLGGIGPVEVARIEDGDSADFDSLADVRGIEIEGDYAYVSSFADSALTIIDVSDPTNPSFVSKIQDGVGGFDFLSGCFNSEIDDDLLYVAGVSDGAISIVDISGPASPQLIGVIRDGVNGFNNLGFVIDLKVSGDLLYATAFGDDSLNIIDISNPASPQLVSSVVDGSGGFDFLWTATDVEIAGDYAYVAAFNEGALNIIDISTPASPQLVSVIRDDVAGFNNLNSIRRIRLIDELVYVVSQGDNALTVIDVSDKANPVLVAEAIDGVNGFNQLEELYSIDVDGNNIYVASFSETNPTVTIIEQTFDTITVDLIAQNRIGIGTSEPSAELHVAGDAFVTGSLLDSSQQAGTTGQILTTTGSGTEWTTLNVNDADSDPTNELQTLSLNGGALSIDGGATNVDLSSAVNTILDGSSGLGIGLGNVDPDAGLQINSGTGYDIPTNSLISFIDDSVTSTNGLGGTLRIEIKDGYLYAVNLSGDLWVFDVNDLNGAGPVEVDYIDQASNSNSLLREVSVVGDHLFISSQGGTLSILNIADPTAVFSEVVLRDGDPGFDLLNDAYDVAVTGNYLYVVSANSDSGITVMDFSVPNAPSFVTTIESTDPGFGRLINPRGLKIVGNYAFVAATDAFIVLDVSDPINPAFVTEVYNGDGTFNTLSSIPQMDLANGFVYLPNIGHDQLTIIDVTDPTAPALAAVLEDGTGGFNDLDGVRNVAVLGDTAYVVAETDGALNIIDVTTPGNPQLIEVIRDLDGSRSLGGPVDVELGDGLIFISDLSLGGIVTLNYAPWRVPVDLIAQNRIGIGTSEPSAQLHVAGDAFVTGSLLDSSQQAGTSGQVLTTSGTGTEWANLNISNIGAGTFANDGNIRLNRFQKLNVQEWETENGLFALPQLNLDGSPSGVTFGNAPNLKGNTANNPDASNFNAINQVALTSGAGGILGAITGGNEIPALSWSNSGNVNFYGNIELRNIESDLILHSKQHGGGLGMYDNATRKFGDSTVTGPVLYSPFGGALGTTIGGNRLVALRWQSKGHSGVEPLVVIEGDSVFNGDAFFQGNAIRLNNGFSRTYIRWLTRDNPFGDHSPGIENGNGGMLLVGKQGGIIGTDNGSTEAIAMRWWENARVSFGDDLVAAQTIVTITGQAFPTTVGTTNDLADHLLNVRTSNLTEVLVVNEDNTVDITNLNVTGTATLPAGSIDGSVIAAGSLDGAAITASSIDGAAITAGSLDGSAITAGSLDGSTIAAGSLDGAAITVGSVDGSAIENGSIEQVDLAQFAYTRPLHISPNEGLYLSSNTTPPIAGERPMYHKGLETVQSANGDGSFAGLSFAGVSLFGDDGGVLGTRDSNFTQYEESAAFRWYTGHRASFGAHTSDDDTLVNIRGRNYLPRGLEAPPLIPPDPYANILRIETSDGTDILIAKEAGEVEINNLSVTGTASLPAGSISSSAVADGTIVATDIADNAITTNKIADDAVTLDKLADNVPTLATSRPTHIIHGSIDTNTVFSTGHGYSISRTANTTGQYVITWSTPFVGTLSDYTLVITPETDGDTRVATIINKTNSSATIRIRSLNGNAQNAGFSFMAIGY